MSLKPNLLKPYWGFPPNRRSRGRGADCRVESTSEIAQTKSVTRAGPVTGTFAPAPNRFNHHHCRDPTDVRQGTHNRFLISCGALPLAFDGGHRMANGWFAVPISRIRPFESRRSNAIDNLIVRQHIFSVHLNYISGRSTHRLHAATGHPNPF